MYIWDKVKLRLNQGKIDNVEVGRGIRQGCCMSPILFNLYGEYLMKGALAEFKDFKIVERINKVRFVDNMAIIAKTQEQL